MKNRVSSGMRTMSVDDRFGVVRLNHFLRRKETRQMEIVGLEVFFMIPTSLTGAILTAPRVHLWNVEAVVESKSNLGPENF